MKKYRPVTHVVFDVDGLLIDTETIYTQANSNALARHNRQFTWELKKHMMGRSHTSAIRILLADTDLDKEGVTPEDYDVFYKSELKRLFPECKFMPGAERLVQHLKKHNIPIALCTGSDTESYEWKTGKHRDFFAQFSHVVLGAGSDPDVKHGKPFPDCYEVAARRFVPPPASHADVLVFEDATNGVESALAAGMQVVMVPDPRVDATERQRATLCLDNLEHFDPTLFGLPAYNC